ncbi:MAG TPA: hypothetical protein DCS93_12000 [Microscillaceae bacterium]|nr:hypothetical protein [Microscillaceae bacterium]
MKNKQLTQRDTIIRYLMVIPLIFLAGWLLQKSFWLRDDADAREYRVYHQQEKPDQDIDIHINDDDFHFDFDFNGEKITIENKEELEKLGKELEENLKHVVLRELSDGLKEWKKRDLPKLKKDLKKLKKELRYTIKDNIVKELKKVERTERLDKTERELLNTIEDLVKSLDID